MLRWSNKALNTTYTASFSSCARLEAVERDSLLLYDKDLLEDSDLEGSLFLCPTFACFICSILIGKHAHNTSFAMGITLFMHGQLY